MLMLPRNQVLVLLATALLTTGTPRTLPRTFLVPCNLSSLLLH